MFAVIVLFKNFRFKQKHSLINKIMGNIFHTSGANKAKKVVKNFIFTCTTYY